MNLFANGFISSKRGGDCFGNRLDASDFVAETNENAKNITAIAIFGLMIALSCNLYIYTPKALPGSNLGKAFGVFL